MGIKLVLDTELFDQKGKRAIKLRIKPLNEGYSATPLQDSKKKY